MASDPRFFNNYGPFSLAEIAKIAGAEIYQQTGGGILISDVAPLEIATENHISFLVNSKYLEILSTSKASACFINKKYIDYAPKSMVLLVSDNSYKSYALAASVFYPQEVGDSYIDPTAAIESSAAIDETCFIEPNVVVGENVSIGKNCTIGANSVIASGVIIGDNTIIGPNVTISHAIIGNNVLLHPGVRIGQDGFGFASDRSGHYKVPQLGRVKIGNNVEIGANSCIDRGSGHDTIIGDGCMIDNLVQIGHNVELGKNCVVVAQVGIAGSTKLGDFVVLGGQVGVSGHLNIGSGAQVAAQSGVIKDIPPMEVQGGYPAFPVKQWHRQTAMLKKLIQKASKKND